MKDKALESICVRCGQNIFYDGSFFHWFHYDRQSKQCSMNPPEPVYVNGLLNMGNLAVNCVSCGHAVCPTTWDDDCAFCGKMILSKQTLDKLAITNLLSGEPPTVATMTEHRVGDTSGLDYLEDPRG